MVKVTKTTEFAVGRKGKVVSIAHRKDPKSKWQIANKETFKDEGTAKAYHKDKLDALIKRYPDNIVRSNIRK